MNIEKWTTAMQEALQKAFQNVLSMKRQVVDIEDVILALLEDTQGIMSRTFLKANIDIRAMQNDLVNKIQTKPTLSQVDESQIRTSYDLNQLLMKAQMIQSL